MELERKQTRMQVSSLILEFRQRGFKNIAFYLKYSELKQVKYLYLISRDGNKF